MANESALPVTCAQADCKVAEGGPCLEGFEQPLGSCPHYGKPRLVKPATVSTPAPVLGVALPSGETLDLEGVFSITRNTLCRIVVVAGSEDAGKTTLIASLYERFQRGPVGGYSFGGSHTTLGFERRCHLARAACRGLSPDTTRTPLGAGQRFLHLAIAHSDRPTQRRDLIISDVSGEFFRQARDSREEARKLAFVGRADHFVLLLDGAKLLSAETRAASRMEPSTWLSHEALVGV